MIVVWKNDGTNYAGKEIEFFKVSWSGLGWLRDPDGPYWGIEHPVFDTNIRLFREARHYGTVKESEARSPEIKLSAPSPILGRPVLGVIDEEE